MNIMAHDDAGDTAEPFARVMTDRGAASDIQCGGERDRRLREGRFDQRLTHPAPGAGDGKPYCTHGQGTGGAVGLPSLLNQSMTLPMKPASSPYGSSGSARVAAVRFSSCTDCGISSPSQRVSASSLK